MSDYQQTPVSIDPHFVEMKTILRSTVELAAENGKAIKAQGMLISAQGEQIKVVNRLVLGTVATMIGVMVAKFINLI